MVREFNGTNLSAGLGNRSPVHISKGGAVMQSTTFIISLSWTLSAVCAGLFLIIFVPPIPQRMCDVGVIVLFLAQTWVWGLARMCRYVWNSTSVGLFTRVSSLIPSSYFVARFWCIFFLCHFDHLMVRYASMAWSSVYGTIRFVSLLSFLYR